MTRTAPRFLLCFGIFASTASAQTINLLGQTNETSAEERLNQLARLPLPTAIAMLNLAPDSAIFPPAVELPFIRAVLPELIKKHMGESFDEPRLRAGLDRGIARYTAPPRDPRLARDRLQWFTDAKADLDRPAQADPEETAANRRDIDQFAAEMTTLIRTDRQLDPILARVRELYAASQAQRTPLPAEHKEKLAEAEPLKLLRNRYLGHYMDSLVDYLQNPRTGLTQTSVRQVAPVIALFKIFQDEAEITSRVVILRAGAQAELERRAQGRPAGGL